MRERWSRRKTGSVPSCARVSSRRRECMPTTTFSAALRSLNRRMFWKVRAMPSPATRCAGRPVSWSDSSHALPDWKGTYPVITLTSVVLPAPLGPIRPWIDPCSTSSDTPSTACTPPKWRRTSSRRSSTHSRFRPPGGPHQGEPTAADDPLRSEHDDGDQEDAGEDVDVVPGALEDVWKQRDDER